MSKSTDKSTNLTASTDIWSSIKERPINVFGMMQKVSDVCQHSKDYDGKCFLTCKATAVFAMLETLLEKEYTCEQVEKYVVVSKK